MCSDGVRCWCFVVFLFQAEDGIRDLVRSRGLGDVYKRQVLGSLAYAPRDAKGLVTSVTGTGTAASAGQVWELSLIHI